MASLRLAKLPRGQDGPLMAESSLPPEETGEAESWVRQRITDGIEIHHKTPLPEDEEAKLFDLVSRARAIFRTKDIGARLGTSRFFHRPRNRTK